MNADTELILTYGTLRQMLIEFQMDGMNAERLDVDEEIQSDIKGGSIKIHKERDVL